MKIAVDIGNSTCKIGVFQHDLSPKKVYTCHSPQALQKILATHEIEKMIVSSVAAQRKAPWLQVLKSHHPLFLNADTPLPLPINYTPKHSLGADRLAAGVGALCLYPHKHCLVIDLGTCITYSLITSTPRFAGGAISPGLEMRLQALSDYTEQLPRIKLQRPETFLGTSTEASIQAGVCRGAYEEILGMIAQYEQLYPAVHTLLCGGHASFFDFSQKSNIHIEKHLVLIGLYRILKTV